MGRFSKNQSPEEQRISYEIVCSVADRIGVEPTDLPPLYETIDPEALDAIVASCVPGSAELQVTFTYADYRIRIRCLGESVFTSITTSGNDMTSTPLNHALEE